MSLDPQLLEILACPAQDHASLHHNPETELLTCLSCGREYPVRDGLPVLLLDAATVAGTGTGAGGQH